MATPKTAKVGDILLFQKAKGEEYPLLVTSTDKGGVNGRVFLHGTQTEYVEGADFGDKPGQVRARD